MEKMLKSFVLIIVFCTLISLFSGCKLSVPDDKTEDTLTAKENDTVPLNLSNGKIKYTDVAANTSKIKNTDIKLAIRIISGSEITTCTYYIKTMQGENGKPTFYVSYILDGVCIENCYSEGVMTKIKDGAFSESNYCSEEEFWSEIIFVDLASIITDKFNPAETVTTGQKTLFTLNYKPENVIDLLNGMISEKSAIESAELLLVADNISLLPAYASLSVELSDNTLISVETTYMALNDDVRLTLPVCDGAVSVVGDNGAAELFQFTSKEDRIYYDSKTGVAKWPAQVINYTNKTQFLFRIEKGVLDIMIMELMTISLLKKYEYLFAIWFILVTAIPIFLA
jgi:hypothetical protein